MADDGMLLNFAIGDNVIKPEAKFKGGTWRARLSAKKRSQHRPTGNDDPSQRNADSKNPNKIQIPANRPAKRQRFDEDGPSGRPTHRSQPQAARRHPGQFASSLFTSNPESKTVEEPKPEEPAEEAKPSNAALVDGIDTFTSLGLSANLAAHLLTKLELKAPTAIQKASITQLLKEETDAFIQAETGSGKTLAYLLPLVQRIMALSKATNTKEEGVHRDSGLFAIVLAPTRELCKQISVVLENLLRCANWLVAGTVIGGEKKKSEKARLRKGLNILVATPGRLADHLENTQVLDVSNVRWLILDEGDRLMDLGFEEELQGIVSKLDARQRPSRIPGMPTRRTTVLCSATLKMNVQRLGEISLKDAVHIKADPADEDGESRGANKDDESFRVPAQLKQSYAVVPAKLRLVSLTAYLKRTFIRKGSVMKAIVFVSCADSVDFHFEVFSRKYGERRKKSDDNDDEDEKKDEGQEAKKPEREALSPHGTIAPAEAFSTPSNPVTIHRLHGSLPQHVRTATLNSFSKSKEASVMICTDVASRGLDLPNVDLVIEYDPAFSSDDHTHRIGRTARLGRDGRACIFLQPGCEESYVEILKRGYRDGGKALTRTDANEILRRGFGATAGSTSKNWEEKTTDWQMDVERWALDNPEYLEMARRGFQSHVRAYATHIAAERSMFDIKELHLGHLAKAFALRDRPGKINVPGLRQGKEDAKKDFKAARNGVAGSKRKADDDASTSNTTEAARKMRAKMREQMSGASEFNLA
ncbi:hypothetical protein N7528_003161 [Penicillium herquei]|nr:hypothetical protein N7528_003161 [Penicillium herquei]